MAKQSVLLHALTVGEISKEALSRVDLTKTRLAAEVQVNLLPKTIGSAYFRPPFQYLSTAPGFEVMRPFAISAARDAIVHFRSGGVTISLDGQMVSRQAVSSTVANGDFSTTASWTLGVLNGANAEIAGGQLLLQGLAQGGAAAARQTVTTASVGQEHAMRVVVTRGSVEFRIGSTLNGQQLIRSTMLAEGTHSLTFTPTTSSYFIRLRNTTQRPCYVTSCQVEGAGELFLPTLYAEADLRKIRWDQSGDVMFLACDGYEQRKIERRSLHSWSVTRYLSEDGPFGLVKDSPAKLQVTELYGSATLNASQDYFTSDMVGRLIYLFHNKQRRRTILAADEEFTLPIRVAGIKDIEHGYNDRDFSYTVTGTWAGTLTWQRAYGTEDGGYAPYKNSTTDSTVGFTANPSGVERNDDYDSNSITFYKLGFQSGDYTSGAAVVTVGYDGGTTDGIVRITSVSDGITARVDILEPPGDVTYTSTWRAGQWSNETSWPAAVSFYDGRLFWAGLDQFWGSVSDEYYSYDENKEGDSAPILRNMAVGRGVQKAKWILPLSRLIIGTEGCEIVVKSSSLDEPITANGITLKAFSDFGSADNVCAVIAGNNGLFIDRTEQRLIEIRDASGAGDYTSDEITKVNRDILKPGVVDLAVQRNPDTRAWHVRSDGKCIVLTYDEAEEIKAFTPIEAGGNGLMQSICVSRQDGLDRVTALFKRTINGATVYTRERMMLDDTAAGARINCEMDCYRTGTLGSPSSTISGLGLYEGLQVAVNVDGVPLEQYFTVTGGQINVGVPVTNYVVGLPFEWRFKSAKLAYASSMGTAINQRKRVDKIGFQLVNTHNKGIKYGRSFDDSQMYALPNLVDENDVSNVTHSEYDHDMNSFDGQWSTDSRVYLKGRSPFSCTVSGLTFTITTHDAG
jgi:hypothetical protein